MSTVTRRFDGALPDRPVTVIGDVTAAPLSGIDTSAVFSKDVPSPPPPSPGREPTFTPAHASCTALYSALSVPYSSPAAARMPVRAAASLVGEVNFVVSARNQIFSALPRPMPVTGRPSEVGES